MSEQILLFATPAQESAKIQKIASQMRIKTRIVDASEYGLTIGQLAENVHAEDAGINQPDNTYKSLMVMCNLTEKHMDRLLFALRRDNIEIGYKAILTPVNAAWSVPKMYAHMELEHKLTH